MSKITYMFFKIVLTGPKQLNVNLKQCHKINFTKKTILMNNNNI